MLNRVGDLAHSNQLTRMLQSTQARIRDAQVEIASGKQSRRYDEITDQAGLLLQSREQFQLTDRFVAENEQALHRLRAMDSALRSITDIAQHFRDQLVTRLQDATGKSIPLDADIDNMLNEIEGQLNLKLDDRYLFAGSRTDTRPVELPSPTPTMVDASVYYRGDNRLLAHRADVDTEIEFGVTADDPAFAGLVAAFGKAREAHALNDREGLKAALDGVSGQLDRLATLRGSLATASTRIDSIMNSQRDTALYLGEVIGSIEDTDQADAVSRMARDSANLEASYLTIARINSLSLTDYLR